jgi:hypothetical protein
MIVTSFSKNKVILIRNLLVLSLVISILYSIILPQKDFQFRLFSSQIQNNNNNDRLMINEWDFTHPYFGRSNSWSDKIYSQEVSVEKGENDAIYFLANELFDLTNQHYKTFLGKLSNNHSTIWTNQLTIYNNTIGKDLYFDSDNQRLFCIGETFTNENKLYHQIVVGCFDSNTGELLWNKSYGQSLYSEKGFSLDLFNEQLVVIGTSVNYYSYNYKSEIFIGSIDLNSGIMLWNTTLAEGYYNTNPKIAISQEQNRLFCQFSRRISEGSITFYQQYLLEISSEGGILQEQMIDLECSCNIYDFIIRESTEKLLLTGSIAEGSPDSSYTDIILLEFNFNLNNERESIFGTSGKEEIAFAIESDSTGNVFLGGNQYAENTRTDIAFLIKLTPNWEVCYFIDIDQFYKSTIYDFELSDNGGLISGSLYGYELDLFRNRLLISKCIDTDNDGLATSWETLQGTDPNNPDTDGDGWSDREEYIYHTDPCKARSNPNSQDFWKQFGIVLFFAVIIIFMIIHFYFQLRGKEKNKKQLDGKGAQARTPIVRFCYSFWDSLKLLLKNKSNHLKKEE